MSNQLIAYDRIDDVQSFVTTLGRSIAVSKMFGCESEAQGQVMALECIARKMPPLMIAEKYHLIYGKLSMKTEAMLADFRTIAKGSHKIKCRTADKVAIELITCDGDSHTFELTWEEAKLEPFPYDGKESVVVETIAKGDLKSLKLKPKYATGRSRMQMLWARLVSDAIRCVAPEVICGSYTPEEVSDFESMPEAVRNEAPPEDAEVVEVVEPTITTIETVVEQPADPETDDSMTNDDPCLEPQIQEIKDALGVAEQLPGLKDIVARVKAKLVSCGLKKLADLTYSDAARLLEAINRKQVDAFFEADLKAHGGTEAKN